MGIFGLSRRQMVAPDHWVNATHTESKYGVVIGSFGMPGVIELSIALVRKTCGDVPILVADDHTPCSMWQMRLMQLPEKWGNVSVVMTGENLGHAPGDIRAYRNGLRWAGEHGIRYICKLSQRFLFTLPGWLPTWCEEMEREKVAVSSQRAVHLHMGFALRSECVFLDVQRCLASTVFMDRINPLHGKIPTSAEDWLAAAINEGGLGPVYRCRLIPVDRFAKREGVVWHNTHGRDDYHNDGGEVYRQLAEEMGIDLGPEFSAAGWHVIHPNRPDAKYHML